MQVLDQTYNSIISGRYRTRNLFAIDDVEFTDTAIKNATIDGVLFDELSIGNAACRELKLTLACMPVIDKGAEIEVSQQVYNASQQSSWIPKGTFYIARKQYDHKARTLEITANDAMKKADVPFLQTGDWVSTTALNIVQLVASSIGATLSARAETLLSDGYVIDYIPAIGSDGTTGREMLQYIGTIYAANWTINDEGELDLIPLAATPEYTDILDDAANCISQGALPAIDRVKISNGNSVYKYPANFDSLSGTILVAECPYASEALALRIYNLVAGFVYVPYKAERAYMEPAAGLGDGVNIYDLSSVIAKQTLNFSNTSPSDLSAEYSDEDADEYPYVSPSEKAVTNSIAALDGSIEGRAKVLVDAEKGAREESEKQILDSTSKLRTDVDSITGTVSQMTSQDGVITKLQTTVKETADGFEAITEKVDQAGDYINEQKSYMRWNGSAANPYLSVGKDGAPVHTEMRSDAFAVCKNDQDVLIADETGIKAKTAMQAGKYKWIDEGANGFSLVYVG